MFLFQKNIYLFISFNIHLSAPPPKQQQYVTVFFPLASMFIHTACRFIVLLPLCCLVQHGPIQQKSPSISIVGDALPLYLVFQVTSGFIVNTASSHVCIGLPCVCLCVIVSVHTSVLNVNTPDLLNG